MESLPLPAAEEADRFSQLSNRRSRRSPQIGPAQATDHTDGVQVTQIRRLFRPEPTRRRGTGDRRVRTAKHKGHKGRPSQSTQSHPIFTWRWAPGGGGSARSAAETMKTELKHGEHGEHGEATEISFQSSHQSGPADRCRMWGGKHRNPMLRGLRGSNPVRGNRKCGVPGRELPGQHRQLSDAMLRGSSCALCFKTSIAIAPGRETPSISPAWARRRRRRDRARSSPCPSRAAQSSSGSSPPRAARRGRPADRGRPCG